MPVPLEQFVKHLEDSGILADDTLKDFIPPKASPKDAEELARELIRKKKLTKFQAEEVYRGNGKALVLGNYTILDKKGTDDSKRETGEASNERTQALKLDPPQAHSGGGQTVVLTVSIARKGGFNDALTIQPEGLPKGITVVPCYLAAGSTSP